MFWARINDVFMAEYDETGPGMRGVEQILVSVVSISKTREFVAASDENTKRYQVA